MPPLTSDQLGTAYASAGACFTEWNSYGGFYAILIVLLIAVQVKILFAVHSTKSNNAPDRWSKMLISFNILFLLAALTTTIFGYTLFPTWSVTATTLIEYIGIMAIISIAVVARLQARFRLWAILSVVILGVILLLVALNFLASAYAPYLNSFGPPVPYLLDLILGHNYNFFGSSFFDLPGARFVVCYG